MKTKSTYRKPFKSVDESKLSPFSKNLRQALISSGITLLDLSIESGISQPAISNIIDGVREPMLSTAVKISIALNVSLDDLCREVNQA